MTRHENPLEEQYTSTDPFAHIRPQLPKLIFGAMGLIVFVAAVTMLMNAVGIPQLQQWIENAGPLAPLAYIALKATTYVFAPLTSGPIQVFSGTLFGNVWLGTLYTIIGEVIGGSISFWIARRFGRPVVARFVGKDGMQQVDAFYERRLGGWMPLAIARTILFSFWDFLSYAAGLAPVKFRTYVIVSTVCGFFPTLLFVWVGENFVNDTGSLLLSYGLLVVLTIIPILLMRPISLLLENLSKSSSKSETDVQ
jgi:uncharacterized membrane protein YdjX (TVP38/TMEM64 family)